MTPRIYTLIIGQACSAAALILTSLLAGATWRVALITGAASLFTHAANLLTPTGAGQQQAQAGQTEEGKV